MPTQKIGMLFYKNIIPNDITPYSEPRFNTRAPPAKYFRKGLNCCETETTKQQVVEVYKNVKECCDGFTSLAPRTANTAFPFDACGNRPDYYTTNTQYLQSRCKTYDQRKYNFNRDPNTGEATANCCSAKDGLCKSVVYKPNNAQYSTQGAVDASTRLLRLKYNTVTTSAKYNQYRRLYRGDTIEQPLLQDAPPKRPYRNGEKTICNC